LALLAGALVQHGAPLAAIGSGLQMFAARPTGKHLAGKFENFSLCQASEGLNRIFRKVGWRFGKPSALTTIKTWALLPSLRSSVHSY
jgi:hypothetical protein